MVFFARMTGPSLQLWQHGTVSCRITPATESAPYVVMILDGVEAISVHVFAEHHAALTHALEALAGLMQSFPEDE